MNNMNPEHRETALPSVMSPLSPGQDHQILPRLSPPSADEAEHYYIGLHSEPRLVGRTSAGMTDWPPPMQRKGAYSWFPKKTLAPIGPHHILRCWESTVRDEIVHALGRLEWTSIDVFRIGYDTVPVLERPIVVWIGTARADAPWDPVIAGALCNCRVVLDQAGLHDVECEIRVSEARQLAGPCPQLISGYYDSLARPISTSIGQAMCPAQDEDHQGSLCIYVSPAGNSDGTGPLWALTCRHVALPEKLFPYHQRYTRTPTNTSVPAKKMNMPTAEVIQKSITRVDDKLEVLEIRLEDKDPELQRMQVLHDKLKSFQPAASRLAGFVFWSPPFEQAQYWGEKKSFSFPWARDWCLIELDRKRFPDNARGLTNIVDLNGNLSASELNSLLNPRGENKIKFKCPKGGLMRVSGVIPMAEIRAPKTLNAEGEECFLVGKRGRTTDLTWGCPSELLSTERMTFKNGPRFETREWAVVGSLGDKGVPFSKGGDSGALVFGVDGRLGGILTRGSGFGRSPDITYVTPMEVVLADIEHELGFKVKVL